jgi:predicted Zn-dependent protease
MQRLAAIADELSTLAQEEDFFLWHAVAHTYRGIVAEALGDARRARTQMAEGLELFAQTGSRLTLVMMNVLCAQALHRLGDDDEAMRLLDAAGEEMLASEEGLMGPEIWRMRGRILARRGERSRAEASYREAMDRAGRQQALSLELRAALDLHELDAAAGQPEGSRATLAGLLARFTEGLDRPELARAASIVAGSPPQPLITGGGSPP